MQEKYAKLWALYLQDCEDLHLHPSVRDFAIWLEEHKELR